MQIAFVNKDKLAQFLDVASYYNLNLYVTIYYSLDLRTKLS